MRHERAGVYRKVEAVARECKQAEVTFSGGGEAESAALFFCKACRRFLLPWE